MAAMPITIFQRSERPRGVKVREETRWRTCETSASSLEATTSAFEADVGGSRRAVVPAPAGRAEGATDLIDCEELGGRWPGTGILPDEAVRRGVCLGGVC